VGRRSRSATRQPVQQPAALLGLSSLHDCRRWLNVHDTSNKIDFCISSPYTCTASWSHFIKKVLFVHMGIIVVQSLVHCTSTLTVGWRTIVQSFLDKDYGSSASDLYKNLYEYRSMALLLWQIMKWNNSYENYTKPTKTGVMQEMTPCGACVTRYTVPMRTWATSSTNSCVSSSLHLFVGRLLCSLTP
jgi:hypothetical protein